MQRLAISFEADVPPEVADTIFTEQPYMALEQDVTVDGQKYTLVAQGMWVCIGGHEIPLDIQEIERKADAAAEERTFLTWPFRRGLFAGAALALFGVLLARHEWIMAGVFAFVFVVICLWNPDA